MNFPAIDPEISEAVRAGFKQGAESMAKSVQEFHKPTCEHSGDKCAHLPACPMAICITCGEWPCETSKKIYSTKKLVEMTHKSLWPKEDKKK